VTADDRVRRARALFVLAVLVQLVVLYLPRGVDVGGGLPGLDKVVHVAVFGAVAATGTWAGLRLRWLAAALAAHAFVSEVVQHWLLPGRAGDPLDTVADLVGVALGLALGVAAGPDGGRWRHDR
jgi:hypothetical protein